VLGGVERIRCGCGCDAIRRGLSRPGHGGLHSQIARATWDTPRLSLEIGGRGVCVCLPIHVVKHLIFSMGLVTQCVSVDSGTWGWTHTWVDCRIAMMLTLKSVDQRYAIGGPVQWVKGRAQQMLPHVAWLSGDRGGWMT
jgi:hypothetical protein